MQLVARVDEVALCSSFGPLKGMAMSSQPTDIMISKNKMKARMSEIIDQLASDQREHFTYALEQVASCYVSASSHGALLISNETDESQSLVAINASEVQISELVTFMAEAICDHVSRVRNKFVN